MRLISLLSSPSSGSWSFPARFRLMSSLPGRKAEEASRDLVMREEEASSDLIIRGVKMGGSSRMKVLAEIMDAHRREDLRAEVERLFSEGADIVDLGFGFDATPGDVTRCFAGLGGIEGPLAADTQDPALIRAALPRADLVLSLHGGNIPVVGEAVAASGSGRCGDSRGGIPCRKY